jgi:hypothetical protein
MNADGKHRLVILSEALVGKQLIEVDGRGVFHTGIIRGDCLEWEMNRLADRNLLSREMNLVEETKCIHPSTPRP